MSISAITNEPTAARPSASTGRRIYKGPVQVSIEWISPAFASELLGRNNHNRHLREQRVNRIARDIRVDEFDLNGETIKIANDGTIIDGQHRLWAIVVADKGAWTVVVSGLPLKTQDTVDRVQPRNLADALRIDGETNSNLLAGTINNAMVLLSDTPGDPSKSWPTMHEGLDYLARHPELRTAVSRGELLNRVIRTWAASAAAMYHIFARIDEEDANFFFDKLTTGADLSADSPIYKLRDFMMRENSVTRRVNRIRLHAYYIKAWNAYRRGTPMQQLRWATGGSHPEDFPRPE